MDDQTARQQSSRVSLAHSRSSPGPPHQRRFDESWVEVSSQPSSSSLSSIGDEIVTTGLQVGAQYGRRRRMLVSARSLPHQRTAFYSQGQGSPDDGDVSEDDDEDEHHQMASSSENTPSAPEEADSSDSDVESDGDNATALGGRVSERPVFHPQPNAFSHPPSQLSQRSYSSSEATRPAHPHSGFTRPSFSQRSQTRVHRGSPNFMAPNARENNDADLRASLTTLLSCAAAARGLPKTKEEAEAQRAARSGVGPSSQPMDLRLVAESELAGEEPSRPHPSSASTSRQRSSPARSASSDAESQSKARRSTSAPRVPRATKKKKTTAVAQTVGEETFISPTLLTWVVSAGVVVLVSVVGFGAGYVIGREVGRQETLSASMGSVNDTASCGREAIRSSSGTLRKFKWSTVGRSIVA